VVLRRGVVVEDPLGVVLGFLARWRSGFGDPAQPAGRPGRSSTRCWTITLVTAGCRSESPAAVAGSTLAAAALFSPLRSRVQRAVDRRFNRARYDADQMVTAFAARLKNAVDLDSVRDDLAGVVHQTLEPAHLSVWVSQHNFPERRAKRLPKVPGGC
jgi:hypothetical protein